MLSRAHEAGRRAAFSKYARIATPLQDHQQRVVDRIQDPNQPGLVVAHGLGSGKTLASIAAQEALGLSSDVVLPAALRTNYKKEVGKHVAGNSQDRSIQSMQGLAGKGEAARLSNPLLIVDEAHRARDTGTSTYQALAQNDAQKRLLLTASPFYNHPADLASLINLAAGRPIQPTDQAGFEKKYVSEKKVSPGLWAEFRGVRPGTVPVLNPGRKAELEKTYAKWVDYHKSTPEGYPTVTREDVPVEMSRQQTHVYDTVLNKAPPWMAYKIRNGLPPSKAEAKQLNQFLIGTRQVSNSTAPFQSGGPAEDPKIEAAFNSLKANLDGNAQSKAVVYSNFLQAGLDPYKQRLDAAKIPYGEFTGKQTKAQRDDLVDQYNNNKLRALLISSAGGEGLDLKGTRLMQILEPHWNFSKTDQIEGRGIRYQSHAHLAPEDRNVLVQRYLATRPRSGVMEKLHLRKPGGSVDEYMYQRSQEKEDLINQFRQLLPGAH